MATFRPTSKSDDREVGDGAPGPVSSALGEHFERVTTGGDPAFAHWLAYVGEA